MKLLSAFLRLLYGTPMATLVEDLHARFIGDWLDEPSPDFVHPQCTWTLAEDYPLKASSTGVDFYSWYESNFTVSFDDWKQVVFEIIGSPIGAIVIGRLHFQYQFRNYTAPFTHFYRIRKGKIVNAQYFIGMKEKSIYHPDELVDMFPVNSLPSLN